MLYVKPFCKKRALFVHSKLMRKGRIKRIYLDNAAATPVDPRVLRAMLPYFSDRSGNPGAIHREGVLAAEAVHSARKGIAQILQSTEDSVVFTGSGTEANNLALIGLVEALHDTGRPYASMEIVVGASEHPSVLQPARFLKRRGVGVTVVRVREDGRVDPADVARRLSKRTVLVSAAYVNSEIGTIAPLRDIAKVVRAHRGKHRSVFPYFHTDACQAALYLPLSTPRLGVDLMTLDAQKIHGPKGVGLLMKRRGVPLRPLLYGGGQERGLRSGTENVPGIVGFAEALQIAAREREGAARKVAALRDKGIDLLLSALPGARLNGSREHRAANNINITVPGVDGELMVLTLDRYGVAAGAKSACERESGPSHVLSAMGLGDEDASSSLRLTLDRNTRLKDIVRVASLLADLRARQAKIDSR